jgi:hypothetical protein
LHGDRSDSSGNCKGAVASLPACRSGLVRESAVQSTHRLWLFRPLRQQAGSHRSGLHLRTCGSPCSSAWATSVGADLSAKAPSSRHTGCGCSGPFASKLAPTCPACSLVLWEPACWRRRRQPRERSAAMTGLFATTVVLTGSLTANPRNSALPFAVGACPRQTLS